VHLFGQMADMTALMALARAHELSVVEDAAQAHGARHAGRRAGSLGHAAAFSFFPGKNLGAYGDGGAVVTASRRLSDWLMMARQHGSRQKFQHEFIGTNSRLDELQAAILRVKLKHLDAWNSRRREIAKLYDRELAEVCEVRPLRVKVEDESARHLYVVRLPQRDKVQDHLRRQGIQTAAHYPSLLADQPALAAAARTSPATRVAKDLSHQVLSLPIHPSLCDSDVLRISAALKACFVTRSP
jgi:dTDP-4-amino-4,6-dideoxygalactose transaminase